MRNHKRVPVELCFRVLIIHIWAIEGHVTTNTLDTIRSCLGRMLHV